MNEKSLFFLLLGLFFFFLILWLVMKLLIKREGPELENQDLIPDGEYPAKTLYSEKYDLAGKPDMILKKGNERFPIEVKSSFVRDKPYPSHILQLIAYCLLIEEYYGVRPSYGILRYRNKDFQINYTKDRENSLLTQLRMMRQTDPENSDLPPVCEDSRKCRHCGYKRYCSKDQDTLF